MQAQPKINIESVAFDEYEAYLAAVEQVSVQLTLTRRDSLRWSLHKLDLENAVYAQKGCVGSGNICQGATQQGGYNVFLMRAFERGVVNGVPFSSGSVCFLPPGAEFCITADGPHEWLSVFIPAETLPNLDLERSWSGRGRRQAGIAQGMTGAASNMWSLIERYLACAEVDAGVKRAPASVENFKAALTENLANLIGGTGRRVAPGRGRPPAVDWRRMSSTAAILEAFPERLITIEDLVRTTGVSERALRRGFQRFYGRPPRQYLQLRRLHQARRMLRDAHPDETTVTSIAAQLGMWDFGRFAYRYRRLFGERPSDTLRRAKGVFQVELMGNMKGTTTSVAA